MVRYSEEKCFYKQCLYLHLCPWTWLPRWLPSRCVPDNYGTHLDIINSPAAFHGSWNLNWNWILELLCQLNGNGVMKGFLLSKGYNLSVREGGRNHYTEKTASFLVLLNLLWGHFCHSLTKNNAKLFINLLFFLIFSCVIHYQVIRMDKEGVGDLLFFPPRYLLKKKKKKVNEALTIKACDWESVNGNM